MQEEEATLAGLAILEQVVNGCLQDCKARADTGQNSAGAS